MWFFFKINKSIIPAFFAIALFSAFFPSIKAFTVFLLAFTSRTITGNWILYFYIMPDVKRILCIFASDTDAFIIARYSILVTKAIVFSAIRFGASTGQAFIFDIFLIFMILRFSWTFFSRHRHWDKGLRRLKSWWISEIPALMDVGRNRKMRDIDKIRKILIGLILGIFILFFYIMLLRRWYLGIGLHELDLL